LSYCFLVERYELFDSRQPFQTQTNFLDVEIGFVVQVYLSVPTLVTAPFLEHETPFEILVAACTGAMAAVEVISSAASATEVFLNICPPLSGSPEITSISWRESISRRG